MPFRSGDHLGDYEILRLLGAGGMGEVYQVRNVLSDRIEAIKVLPSALQANKDLQERFLREIKISAALRHPHIAELRTAQRVDGLLVMVMEFVDGVSLDYLLRNGPLPLKNALHYTRQVLEALDFAHARGVVHRDIKPQNVMVTPGDEIRLMDFGIARSLGDQTLTMTGMTLGSLFYMSPEQIRGEEVDGRADLYSLGIVLYEMVTGVRPFKGNSGYTVMAAHLEQQPPAPVEQVPGLPEPLNRLILQALQKHREQRFASAAEFLEAVRGLDSLVSGPVDGLILTRAFEAKAAEQPVASFPPPQPDATPTQTLPTTPAPASTAARPREEASEAKKSAKPDNTLVTVLGILFVTIVSVIVLLGVFGPKLALTVRTLMGLDSPVANRGRVPSELGRDAEIADEAARRLQSEADAADGSADEASSSGAAPAAREDRAGAPSATPPPPPPAPGSREGGAGERGPEGPRGPREVDEEVRQAMDAASAELKAAGIDMQLFGPSARDGRRFAALERAQDFAAVAKRYATVSRRKSEAEAQRREMFRLLQDNNANRRVRQRVMTEMSTHWQTLSASTAAAEAAIKSQNLKLAEENLSAAEAALSAIDQMMATARQRGGQTSN